MTKDVTMKYRLSETGRKQAILLDRPALETVSETAPTEITPQLLEKLEIQADGSLVLDRAQGHGNVCFCYHELDRPPADVLDLDQMWQEKVTACEALGRENKAQQEREGKAHADQKRQAIERDLPEASRILAEIQALDPLKPLPTVTMLPGWPDWGVSIGPQGEAGAKSHYSLSEEMYNAFYEIVQKRVHARGEAAKAAIQAAREAVERKKQEAVAEHGGYVWTTENGYCGLVGYGLWSGSQDKRWVGVFTEARGIDRFLDNPRGEQIWNVASLQAGERIQGGGYDTNSRGRRRNESQFFGVVLRNDSDTLVVKIMDSRTDALKYRA